MNYASLPPEINSGRMYAGAGAGPMATAAAAWNELAAELNSAAAHYQAVITELTGEAWTGPASSSMAAAAAPYVEWMQTAAAQAEQTATQAMSAVAAFEAAFAATVPPPVVEANRTLNGALVATNVLGQNAAAIAANQAEYAEMWAQDASAMYGYASGAAAATKLAPFGPPPQNTNSSGQANQANAVSQAIGNAGSSQATQVSSSLQGIAAGTNPLQALADLINEFNATPLGTSLTTFITSFGLDNTFMSGFTFLAAGQMLVGPLFSLALPMLGANGGLISSVTAMPAGALGSLAGTTESVLGSASLAGAEVSASMGRAAPLGGLSVPHSWGSAAPEVRLATRAVPLAGPAALSGVGAAGPGFAGGMPLMGPVGSVVNAPRNGEGRLRALGSTPRVIARMPGEVDVYDETPQSWPKPNRGGSEGRPELTDKERDERDRLRDEIAELAMERDAAARLIREAIRP